MKQPWQRHDQTGRSISMALYGTLAALFLGGAPAAFAGGKQTLLQSDDLEYLGAFRLPDTSPNLASRFPYGGHALAFNPHGNEGAGSLMVAGHAHHQLVAEISVPDPMKDADVAKLPTARLLQPFVDVTGGFMGSFKGKSMRLGGLLVHDKRLVWSAYLWYNVVGESLPSHGVSELDFANLNARGAWKVGAYHSQKTAGYMCAVPEIWRKRFQFPLLTGQSLAQGRATSSEGPAAFGFDLSGNAKPLRNGASLPAKPFLHYDLKHTAVYPVEGKLHPWKGANRVAGMAFPVSGDAKRSAVVYFVRLGLHPTDWYGETQDFPGPGKICDGGKGYHAPPYKAMAWFYDPDDLLKVARGAAPPWSIKPYAMKDLSGDFVNECVQLSAVGFDAQARRIYLLEQGADQKNRFESWPVAHVYAVR